MTEWEEVEPAQAREDLVQRIEQLRRSRAAPAASAEARRVPAAGLAVALALLVLLGLAALGSRVWAELGDPGGPTSVGR